MENQIVIKKSIKKQSSEKTKSDLYYCAEFLLSELNMLYQFKIWNAPSKPMFALVKKNSAIMDCLNVGDILNMKYYSTDMTNPTENLKTKIKFITSEDQGRFRGHYLVGLEITHDEFERLN